MSHVSRFTIHPLAAFFEHRRFTVTEGLNWLQERGLISDLCVTVEDVAACDVERVLAQAREALAAKPPPPTKAQQQTLPLP